MRKKLYGVLVAIMLLTVVTSFLDLPILGSDVRDFERASGKTMSSSPKPLPANMTESVWIHGDGSCDLIIEMNVSSYPLNTTYRHALGLENLNISEDDPIRVNETIPVTMDINKNATILPGGYNQTVSMAGYNGTSIANSTYIDPPNANITGDVRVEDEAGENITQPVEKKFLNAVIQEQWHHFGIRITKINASMYGTNGQCFVVINASGLMQVVHCGEIAIGPSDLNASLDRAGFILNKIGFIQQMLRNFDETENQEYIYKSTWRTNFFFTENASLTYDSWQELVNPPQNWTVDFGSGTNMSASILVASTQENIFLKETLLVSDRNITKTEHELVEDKLLCYKIFKMTYQLLFPIGLTSTSCVRESACASCESKDASKISDNWSWKWKIRLWEGQFTLEWSNIQMDVYTNLDLEGYIGWKFKWFKLRWAKAWTRIKPTLIVNITATGSWGGACCKTLFKWSSRYTVWIGPFPVEMLLEFEPIATLAAGITLMPGANITCGTNATGDFTAGVGWERDGGWHMIYDAGMEVNIFEPKVGNATGDLYPSWIKPSLQFRLALLFYELAGPFVEFEPYAIISAEYTHPDNVTYWVDVGISVNAGIKFTGRLKKILKLSDYKWDIWNRVLWSTREEHTHDVMISHINATAKAFITEPINVSVGVINQGASYEQEVNVTLYYWNNTDNKWEEIARNETSLRRGYWKAFNFPWITTADMGPGPCTLNATATIPDTEPTGNNNRTYSVYLEVQNVAITDVTASPSAVNEGEPVKVNVTVVNQGTVNVSALPVSAFYNGNLLSDIWCKHTRWIFDRLPGNVTTLIFTWDTTGVANGSYTISANATLLPYETNPDDNTLEADNPVNVSSTGIHNIAIVNIVPSKTVVGQNSRIYINVTVKNEGNFSGSFYVTTCVNTTIIGRKNSTILGPGASRTITFTWNTTGFSYGNYTIRAKADVVPGETDTADNTYIDGEVKVTVAGDINDDGTVNFLDLYLFAKAWMTSTGNPNYNPNADINDDGIINFLDLFLLAKNWMTSIP